jgi:ketosteroid isomerase-like protein
MSMRSSQDSVMQAPTHRDSSELNSKIVMETYAAVGRGDLPALLDLLAEEVVWSLQGPAEVPFAGIYDGREGVATFFQRVGETLAVEQFEPRTVIAQGDTVVVLGSERSRAHASGRPLVMEWAHVYTISDGRITAFRAFEDTAALVAALAPA